MGPAWGTILVHLLHNFEQVSELVDCDLETVVCDIDCKKRCFRVFDIRSDRLVADFCGPVAEFLLRPQMTFWYTCYGPEVPDGLVVKCSLVASARH